MSPEYQLKNRPALSVAVDDQGVYALTAAQMEGGITHVEIRNTGDAAVTWCHGDQAPVFNAGWRPLEPGESVSFSVVARDLPVAGIRAICATGTSSTLAVARG